MDFEELGRFITDNTERDERGEYPLLYLLALRKQDGERFQPIFHFLPVADQAALLAKRTDRSIIPRSGKISIAQDNPALAIIDPRTREVLLRVCEGLPTRQIYLPRKRWRHAEWERKLRIARFYWQKKRELAGTRSQRPGSLPLRRDAYGRATREIEPSGRTLPTGDSAAIEETAIAFDIGERQVRGIVGRVRAKLALDWRAWAAEDLRSRRQYVKDCEQYERSDRERAQSAHPERLRGLYEEDAEGWRLEAEKHRQRLRDWERGRRPEGRKLFNRVIREVRAEEKQRKRKEERI